MNKRSKKKRLKRIIKAASFALAMTAFSVAVYATQLKEVNINYLGEDISFKTFASTVSGALKEQNIELNDGENVSTSLDSRLLRNNMITIDKPVIIAMAEPEVKEEVVVPEVKEEVKVPEKPIEIQETKPKATSKSSSKTSATSRGNVRTSWGADVTEVGEGVIETADGEILEYTEVMQLEATAYCPCYECCGKYPGNKWYNITATGTVGKVGVIAVDPRVIPLGTKVYIEGLYGAKNYGYGSAEDTGGAIKDLYFNTHRETINWGRQQVKVYILKDN